MTKNQDGYTAIELVTAMIVVSAVMAILFGVFRFTNGLYQRNLDYSEAQNKAWRLASSMEKNILNSRGVVSATQTALAVQKANGRVGAYTWDGEQFFYNNKPYGSKRFKITGAEFEYFGKDPLQEGLSAIDANGDGRIALAETGRLGRIKVSLGWKSKRTEGKFAFEVKVRGKAILKEEPQEKL